MLLQRPSEPRQFYYDAKFERLSANAEGISRLLSMAPDLKIMGLKPLPLGSPVI